MTCPFGAVQSRRGTRIAAARCQSRRPLVHKDGEYPLFDGQGSERTVTNGSQTVTGSINYDAFGQSVGSTGSSSSPYMYGDSSGYDSQGDAGLLHVGARYYDADAQVGRFTTRDTVLDQHPYLYCGHDPVNAVDPSGHVLAVLPLVLVAGVVLAFCAENGARISVSAGNGGVSGDDLGHMKGYVNELPEASTEITPGSMPDNGVHPGNDFGPEFNFRVGVDKE